jgi:hypothetical protein
VTLNFSKNHLTVGLFSIINTTVIGKLNLGLLLNALLLCRAAVEV